MIILSVLILTILFWLIYDSYQKEERFKCRLQAMKMMIDNDRRWENYMQSYLGTCENCKNQFHPERDENGIFKVDDKDSYLCQNCRKR